MDADTPLVPFDADISSSPTLQAYLGKPYLHSFLLETLSSSRVMGLDDLEQVAGITGDLPTDVFFALVNAGHSLEGIKDMCNHIGWFEVRAQVYGKLPSLLSDTERVECAKLFDVEEDFVESIWQTLKFYGAAAAENAHFLQNLMLDDAFNSVEDDEVVGSVFSAAVLDLLLSRDPDPVVALGKLRQGPLPLIVDNAAGFTAQHISELHALGVDNVVDFLLASRWSSPAEAVIALRSAGYVEPHALLEAVRQLSDFPSGFRALFPSYSDEDSETPLCLVDAFTGDLQSVFGPELADRILRLFPGPHYTLQAAKLKPSLVAFLAALDDHVLHGVLVLAEEAARQDGFDEAFLNYEAFAAAFT